MRSTRVNRVILSHRFLTCVLVAAFLAAAVLGDSAQAQTDLNGASKEITASGPWGDSYTNSSDTQSHITIYDLVNSTRYTYSGSLTGNLFIDITHQGYANNENRFTLSNTGNNFTGGVAMHNGILFVTNSNQIVSFTSGLTLDKAVLMAFGDFENTLNIQDGSFGGLRASGGVLQQIGAISGNGDLVIVTDVNYVNLSGTNTYTGVTSIGTVKGGSNTASFLALLSDNTLPSTTVVEVGKSQNATYNNLPATAVLDLKGTTQTIAGLHGSSIATITNSSEDAGANVTINLAAGKSYDYAGSITGKSAALLTNLTITGEGNQTFGGNIANASITSSTTGTLTIGGNTVTLASLEVNGGELKFGSDVAMTVNGKMTAPGTVDLNGSSLTYKSNLATDFNNVAITNTNTEKLSVLTIAPTAELVNQTFTKSVSGNTRLVIKLKTNQDNNSRFMLGGTNTHTGGLYIEQGTVRVDNYATLGTSKQIDMKHSSLMTNQTFAGYTFNLVGDASAGERGAIRLSGGNGNFDAKITGVGSLEIVNDGAVTLTNTGNDYQGKTYLGNFQWRSNGLNNAATLNLGASGVLPDTTEVVMGKSPEGSGISGKITLDLKGFNETVAGVYGQSTNAVITSATPATLIVNANKDYSYAGAVTGSATLEKKGTGTLTITGNNTGSLAVSGGTLILTGDNSGAQSITVGEGGTFIPARTNSAATQINLQGGTLNCYSTPHLDGSTITATAGDSTINIIGPEAGTYARQLFTGTAKDMSDLTNPEFISNMDKIANTAYPSGTYDADVWGNKSGDENNTNLLQTRVVNTTGSPISLDFAYQFRNSVNLEITDSQGNKTVVMDWVDSSAHTVDGGSYEYATNTGSYTFEPGEAYTIEARLFRFNRTIGANGGGLNGFDGTLVGLGAKVSGSEGEYLPLNFDGSNWTFSDGSFVFRNLEPMSFTSPITVSEGASIVINSPNSDLDITSPISGAGTITFNQDEGFVHTYSGTVNAPQLSVVKTGLGTMQINAAQGVFNVKDLTVAAGRLDMKEYLTGRMQVNNGASFSPGNSIGKLTVDGSFALGQALEGGDLAKIIMEIAGTDADQNDQLIVTGDLELNNGVVLLEFSEGIHLNQGDTVTVLFSADNSADLEPTFIKDYVQAPALLQNLSYVQLGSGYWAITAAADYNAVPEPATWALLLLGVFGLLYTRKRR